MSLLLGVDAGGAGCRARLCNFEGKMLGGGFGGPANIRLGVENSLAEAFGAAARCFRNAGLAAQDHGVVACLALAGAGDPALLADLKNYEHPFKTAVYTTDSHAACVGAHGGEDGAVIIIGAGSVGEAIVGGQRHRVGGWGFPVSDEGSGAWLGCEAARRTLWALDGRTPWTPLLTRVAERFDLDPQEIVQWMRDARPGNFATLAPLVIDWALRDDPTARDLVTEAAHHVERLAERLLDLGARRLSLMGTLAKSIEPWLSPWTRQRLTPPAAGPLTGAVHLARATALKGAAA